MACPLHETHDGLDLPVGVDLRRTQTEADTALVHEVGVVELRRNAESITREMHMLRRADECSASARRDPNALVAVVTFGRRLHRRWTEITAAIRRKNAVALTDRFDWPHREVGHRDQRAFHQTLIIVRDGADIPVSRRLRRAAGEQAHQLILRRVGVLEFVHVDVAIAILILSQHLGIAPPELIRQQDQIVEVGGVVLAQQLFVALVDPRRHLLDVLVGALGELHRAEQIVLRPRDDRVDRARLVLLLVEVHLAQRLLHQRLLIAVVVDCEVVGDAQPRALALAPQNARADRVERADAEVLRRRTYQRLEPLLHLARRLVGERHRQHVPRRDASLGEDEGDAVRDHARLAAAGTSQHQQGPLRRGHGDALRLIQPSHEFIG